MFETSREILRHKLAANLISEDFKTKCLENLIKVLAKANVQGNITMIECVFIKDAFLKGKDRVA